VPFYFIIEIADFVAILPTAKFEKLYIPPIVLQKQFVDYKEKVTESKHLIQQSLDRLEILKKALMQEYFGGTVKC
jgi:type I restriction enzyme S subunit